MFFVIGLFKWVSYSIRYLYVRDFIVYYSGGGRNKLVFVF